MENLDAEAGVLAVLDELADVGEAVLLDDGNRGVLVCPCPYNTQKSVF